MGRIAAFDLPGPGDPNAITFDDVRRTRSIGSMVSNDEAWWFERRAAEREVRVLLRRIPPDAARADADPSVEGGLFDHALALRAAFVGPSPGRVGDGKVHEVLHLKRPKLVPILNTHVREIYRRVARHHAADLHTMRGIVTDGYWVAIRADVSDPDNQKCLGDLRQTLRAGTPADVLLASLSDIRLLDLVMTYGWPDVSP
jgi:hypothetical protein